MDDVLLEELHTVLLPVVLINEVVFQSLALSKLIGILCKMNPCTVCFSILSKSH